MIKCSYSTDSFSFRSFSTESVEIIGFTDEMNFPPTMKGEKYPEGTNNRKRFKSYRVNSFVIVWDF